MMRLALVVALLAPAAAFAGPSSAFNADPEIQKLRQEIAATKLDRLLNLTPDQAKKLLPVLKEAQQMRAQLKADMEKRRPEMVKALTAVRDDLRKTGAVTEPSQKALLDARGDVALREVREKVRAMHLKARDILNPEQKRRLHEFDPRPLDGQSLDDGGFGGDKGEQQLGQPEGRGGGKKVRKALQIATTPEFIALVEARAK